MNFFMKMLCFLRKDVCCILPQKPTFTWEEPQTDIRFNKKTMIIETCSWFIGSKIEKPSIKMSPLGVNRITAYCTQFEIPLAELQPQNVWIFIALYRHNYITLFSLSNNVFLGRFYRSNFDKSMSIEIPVKSL